MVSEVRYSTALPDREERQRILESAILVLHDARRVVARCDATQQRLQERRSASAEFAYGMEPLYTRAFGEANRL